MELEFDLGDITPEDEKKTESGGRIPGGWYKADISDAFADSDNDAIKIEFKLTHGPYASRTVSDSLWDPKASKDEDSAQKAADRMRLITKRIGARDECSGKVNFLKAIGRPVVIHLEPKKEPECQTCGQKPEKGSKKRKCPACGGPITWKEVPDSFCNIVFDGVYPPDHAKIPAEVRKQLGLPPAASGDGPSVAGVSVNGSLSPTNGAGGAPMMAASPQDALAAAVADL